MMESSTYRAILREGAMAHARQLVLRVGQKRYGPPSDDVVMTVNAITDLEQIEHLEERMLIATSWQELLQKP